MKVDKRKWEKYLLKDLCTKILAGGDKPQGYTLQRTEVNNIPIYANGIENDGLFGYCSLAKIKEPCITVSGRGTIGYTALHIHPFTPIVRLIVAIPKDILNLVFFKYVISNIHFKHSGVAIPQLTVPTFSKYRIWLPPLSEQQAIASELDAIQDLISKHKEQLKDYDNLAKSIFNEMFGDVENLKSKNVIALGKACDLKAGKGIKASDLKNNSCNGLYPCYGGNGIRGYINRFSNTEDAPLIGRQGALCGNINYARGKFYATEHAVVVTPKIKMNTIWLFYILKYLNLNKYAHGVAQPGLSVKDLVDILIPLANIEVQQTFAHRIEAIEKQKELVKQQITDLQTLFDSRMQYYFD